MIQYCENIAWNLARGKARECVRILCTVKTVAKWTFNPPTLHLKSVSLSIVGISMSLREQKQYGTFRRVDSLTRYTERVERESRNAQGVDV